MYGKNANFVGICPTLPDFLYHFKPLPQLPRHAIVEKYFAATLPDAARKGAREETFDLMEYVDSKAGRKNVARPGNRS